jgi:hypothetical protein
MGSPNDRLFWRNRDCTAEPYTGKNSFLDFRVLEPTLDSFMKR